MPVEGLKDMLDSLQKEMGEINDEGLDLLAARFVSG